jgi:putative endonuclease
LGIDAVSGGLRPWYADCVDRRVNIMTNRPNGTLYVGVTTDLVRRVWEHREGAIEGFTKTYGLKRLVYFEEHASVVAAMQREKNIKHWSRAWKVRLILGNNPGWADLYALLFRPSSHLRP